MRNEKLLLETSGKISANRRTLQEEFQALAVYVINILSILVHLGHTGLSLTHCWKNIYSMFVKWGWNSRRERSKLLFILEQGERGVHEEGLRREKTQSQPEWDIECAAQDGSAGDQACRGRILRRTDFEADCILDEKMPLALQTFLTLLLLVFVSSSGLHQKKGSNTPFTEGLELKQPNQHGVILFFLIWKLFF